MEMVRRLKVWVSLSAAAPLIAKIGILQNPANAGSFKFPYRNYNESNYSTERQTEETYWQQKCS